MRCLASPSRARPWVPTGHVACGLLHGCPSVQRRALHRVERRPGAPLVRCKASNGSEESHLTPPLQVTTLKTLTGEEKMPAPLWSTHCGVTAGLWIGTTSAYSPYTGVAEPVSLQERKPVFQQGTCVVEERTQRDGKDVMLRLRACADTEEAFHLALRQASQGECGSSSEGVVWSEEVIEREQKGLAIFDGGTYSLGPTSIGFVGGLAAEADGEEGLMEGEEEGQEEGEEWDEEGEGVEEVLIGGDDEDLGGAAEPPPEVEDAAGLDRLTSVSEWCLQWGSGRRVRLQLTLSTAGGVDGSELDVEVLRVALAAEQWEGLPGSYAPSSSQQEGMHIGSPGPRLDPKMLMGEWKVFETRQEIIEDVSLETGLPALVSAYTTTETQRRLEAPHEGGLDLEGGDGAVLWLPHRVALQLRLLWPEGGSGSYGEQHGASNGGSRAGSFHHSGNGSGPLIPQLPGLEVGVTWVPDNSTVVSLVRVYSGEGELLGVTYSTAIRA